MGKSSKDKRDAYYRLAKEQGWRARSAFKLLQLDESFNLFEGVTRVVDLCAAPGSWSQVLSRVLIKGERIGRAAWEDKRYKAYLQQHNMSASASASGSTASNAAAAAAAAAAATATTATTTSTPSISSHPARTPPPAPPPPQPRTDIKIVAIDLQPMSPLDGITCLKADITHRSTVPLLLRALDPAYDAATSPPEAAHPVDLVLSDGAPDVTGLHDVDMYVQAQLLWAALGLALSVLRPGGRFVAKIFRGRDVDVLFAQLRVLFARVAVAKPRSSRASSVEAFVVCDGFCLPEGFRAGVGPGLEDDLAAAAEAAAKAERTKKRGKTAAGVEGAEADVNGTRVVRDDGVIELTFDDEDAGDADYDSARLRRQQRWIAPFLACGDLSSFDADASHKLPEGHVSLDPVQPPTAPPYRKALEERKKMGGAYGKTKIGSVG